MQMRAGWSLWVFDRCCNSRWTRWNRHYGHLNAMSLRMATTRSDAPCTTDRRWTGNEIANFWGSSLFRRRELHALKGLVKIGMATAFDFPLCSFRLACQWPTRMHSERLSSSWGFIEKNDTVHVYHGQARVSSPVNLFSEIQLDLSGKGWLVVDRQISDPVSCCLLRGKWERGV